MVYLRLAERFDPENYAYAHRGLWTDEGPPENSLSAFLAAAEHGLGIEFDVRPARDGVPVVFHDPVLDRMTDQTGLVEARTSAELSSISLNGGGTIPTLDDLLHAWPATTPLLCELKVDGATDPVQFAQSVADRVSQHSGPAAMMSFCVDTVAATPDDLQRGQLILPSAVSGATDLAATPTTKVDYLACHTSDAEDPSLQASRADLPLLVWTVKNEANCVALAEITDSQIFEGFDPALAKRHILNR
ncbi:MAG: glycerophosphodiester phosphodiesterase family protein [Pseudomonadota bacterium]